MCGFVIRPRSAALDFSCRWGVSNGRAVIKIGEVSKNVTSPAGRLVNRFQSQGAQGTDERI
jgi:hypothetical protein